MQTVSSNTKQNDANQKAASVSDSKGKLTLPAIPVLQQKETEVSEQMNTTQQTFVSQSVSSADDKQAQHNHFQLKANNTGLPDNLKSGVENLSGMSMDHVKVHYNSSQPAQLNAHAYAQGSDIHIAPGQEKHLPHEAWHVVQQAQGRVQATKQLKTDVLINDDPGLEHEADVMGEKALNTLTVSHTDALQMVQLKAQGVIQRDVNLTLLFGTITNVVADRNNELGIFGDHAGDHTTAHVVFRDMIRNQLLGLTLINAPARLQTLYNEISNLPGMRTNSYVIDDHKVQVLSMQLAAQIAITTATLNPTQGNVEAAAQAVLNFRNAVPMSAVYEGGVGGGEGPQSGRLRMAEDRLRANVHFDLNNLDGILPFNGSGSVREQLAEAVLRLLDVKAVSDNIELAQDQLRDEGQAEHEFAPGFAGIPFGDLHDIVVQHLSSIRMAYPLLWANYFVGVLDDLIPDVLERIEQGNHGDEDYEDL